MSERDIINALCETYGLCPVCYRRMNGMDCDKCINYYSECSCVPLTPLEIINGESEE